jgi:hypothetical protein
MFRATPSFCFQTGSIDANVCRVMTLPAICCVTEGVCSARHDTQHSNAGNVPLDETKKTWQGQGRFGRRITRRLAVCATRLASLRGAFSVLPFLLFKFFQALANRILVPLAEILRKLKHTEQ